MLGNGDNRKFCRKDVVHWIESGWKMVKLESITWTWAKIGIEVCMIQTKALQKEIQLLC